MTGPTLHDAAPASPASPPPHTHRFESSTDIEQAFPHVATIIRRGTWLVHEYSDMNVRLSGLGDYRRGDFNGICSFHFACGDSAAAFRDYAFERRLDRLRANSTHGATREEVALEWERIDAEREEILAWGRATGMLREVVQHYRFERSTGAWSYTAHLAAARHIEKTHPTVADPVNHAGVLIVWAEKEHRAWFWHCCRGNQFL